MSLSRRHFLGAAGGLAALGLKGCNPAMKPGGVARDLGAASITVPDGGQVDEVSHILNRLSYGPRPGEYGRVRVLGVDAYIEEQLHPAHLEDTHCRQMVRRLGSLREPPGQLFEYKEEFLLSELTRATLLRAIYSERQLYEVMVEFWSDHFNIDSSKGDCKWLKTADDREVIRRHALGRFSELLRASALSPAMLWYLDGRVNVRIKHGDAPNENYARELLELHSFGVNGGYTQNDVMEVARCLTGWTVKHNTWFGQGSVLFREARHDDGEKRVLGTLIPAGGGRDDVGLVLDLVASHPATANFIAYKLCRRFIEEDPPEQAVTAVAETFLNTAGDIKSILRTLFGHAAFKSAKTTKLKRPFHFLVSALRGTGAKTNGGGALITYLERMGHLPFQYPSPDGYPDEIQPWLGTLLWRWHFAQELARNNLNGTFVDWGRLAGSFGTPEKAVRHFLARRPTAEEKHLFNASEEGAALLLASPAFQRY